MKKALEIIEDTFLSKKFRSDQPQLFILGLPRTGTTLVYQYIVHRLRVAYFTNGVGDYPSSPCLITWLQHTLYGDYTSDFQSNYGKVSGKSAPREAGSFWARFFGYHDYVKFDDLSTEKNEQLIRIIHYVQKIYGDRPFINKNVKHILRLDALKNIFPNAFFLNVTRNLEDVALSLLQARYKLLDDPEGWWSVRPPAYPSIKDLPKYEQIALQVTLLEKKLNDDLSEIESQRVITVDYKNFCENPEALIYHLKTRIGEIEEKNIPVDRFTISVNEAKNDEEKMLLKYLNDVKS